MSRDTLVCTSFNNYCKRHNRIERALHSLSEYTVEVNDTKVALCEWVKLLGRFVGVTSKRLLSENYFFCNLYAENILPYD